MSRIGKSAYLFFENNKKTFPEEGGNGRTKLAKLLIFLATSAGYWTLLMGGKAAFGISNEIAATGYVGLLVILSHVDLNDKIEALNTKIKIMSKRIGNLARRVGDIDGRDEANANSSLSLTERGAELSKAANAKPLARKYLSHLSLSGQASDYAVQEACLAFAELDLPDKLSGDDKARLEKLAFERGINVARILRVIGFEMRDLILAER